jgi:nicotinate-nucleotide adenylyltransferase
VPDPAPLRIGLFGGTFDPPHVGHLVTAVNVRHELSLDQVLLVVAHVPWQKEQVRKVSESRHRLAMVAAAVEGIPGVEASSIEMDRGGKSYTADTLAELSERFPGAVLHTIVGDDAAAGLTTWERWEEVVARSTLVVVDRPGAPVELPSVASWVRVEVPHLDVSSTDLRERAADGRPLEFLVPDPALDYLRANRLYRENAA